MGKLNWKLVSTINSGLITGSHLLVATGRVPNSDALDLPAAGIETDGRGFIKLSGPFGDERSRCVRLGGRQGWPSLYSHLLR
jgi:hypothetical protein